jgi:hypothetical protein
MSSLFQNFQPHIAYSLPELRAHPSLEIIPCRLSAIAYFAYPVVVTCPVALGVGGIIKNHGYITSLWPKEYGK